MLGPISPEVSARIIFDTPPQPKVQGMATTELIAGLATTLLRDSNDEAEEAA
jgi:hypothetical protein